MRVETLRLSPFGYRRFNKGLRGLLSLVNKLCIAIATKI
ncbi:hypothetical protein EYZ11_006669 [Aspergillus tanneri]|uniref:Uncharacterized protein n=1 Tax=Aspergillus tanneri TaxID=1220188 RepID=A0A4S3JEV8_9EURO|nr:hypothetical protein EYZ11_006669 [Aspergillus tanneri]